MKIEIAVEIEDETLVKLVEKWREPYPVNRLEMEDPAVAAIKEGARKLKQKVESAMLKKVMEMLEAVNTDVEQKL